MQKRCAGAIILIMLVAGIFASGCGKSPAEFTVSDLVFVPAEADVWEEVQVTAIVKNRGGTEGMHDISLTIDGIEADAKEVKVAGGAEETVTFVFVRTVGPSANIAVDGLSRVLTIKEGVLPSLEIEDTWVYKQTTDGVEYTTTLEITNEDTTEQRETYVSMTLPRG